MNIKKVRKDLNGNTRFSVNYREIAPDYNEAKKIALKIGGKTYRGNKDYFVFQCYSEKELQDLINLNKWDKITLYRANCDNFGNPRVIVHYLALADDYDTARKIAKKQFGTIYRGKDFGGGFVFQCYNRDDLILKLEATKNEFNK